VCKEKFQRSGAVFGRTAKTNLELALLPVRAAKLALKLEKEKSVSAKGMILLITHLLDGDRIQLSSVARFCALDAACRRGGRTCAGSRCVREEGDELGIVAVKLSVD
jgi:hypothetical protein